MFILGLLAFLQTVFIPGFILMKYTGFNQSNETGKPGRIRQAVYIFGISLLINYLLVFALTSLGIYRPLTLYIILFIEGGLLIHYWLTRSKPPHCCYMTMDIPSGLNSVKRFFANHSLPYNLLMLLSLAVILWHVFLFFYFLGGVFQHWDPVVGWNRFALDWANNRLPLDTLHYPQLIPSNWSVSYMMMQNTDIQCFAKAFMPLFSLGVLLLFLDLGLRKNKGVYLAGAILFGILLNYIYDPSYIVSGYVDIAVSFYAFLAFYSLHVSQGEENDRRFQSQWYGVIFASAAAVTKQAGLFILVIILLWVIYQKFLRGVQGDPRRGGPIENFEKRPPILRRPISQALLLLLTVGIITAPWYLLKQVQIESGKDRSEIHMVQQAHHTADPVNRFSQSIDRLLTHRHPKLKFPVMLLGIIMILGLFHRQSRGVTLCIVIPYLLLWGFFFSYDFRNLALAVPFMAFSTAHGLEFLSKFLPPPEKFPILKLPIILMLLTLFLAAALLNYTVLNDETLLRNQIQKKMKMGDTELNLLLYDYQKQHGFSGKIATNYQYLRYLPGLEQFYAYHPGRVTKEFLETLDKPEGSEVHYLLVPFILKNETETYLYFREKIEKNEYRLIFKWRGYHFIKVK